jgi:MFS family permease
VIGGVILNWLSWRWLFLVNVPVIAVGLVLARRLLPGDRFRSEMLMTLKPVPDHVLRPIVDDIFMPLVSA